MRLHKKPIDTTPSKLLTTCAKEIVLNAQGLIVDIGCGYGRNAIFLSSFGVPVLCVDFNREALSFIESSQRGKAHLLTVLELDLFNDVWPFGVQTLGAVVNIHCFIPKLLDHFIRSLKVGGYLFIETIDGHGKNYLELPPVGFINEKLTRIFDIKFIKEKKVGPEQSNASSVKLLAIKKR